MIAAVSVGAGVVGTGAGYEEEKKQKV